MEVYSTQRKLGTYSVNDRMLRNVEAYLAYKVPQIIPPLYTNYAFEDNLTLLLSGPDDTVQITPMHEYDLQSFKGSIERATLEFKYHYRVYPHVYEAVVLTLDLGKCSDDTGLSIAVKSDDAREKTLDLEQGLLKCLEPHKNTNWISYPGEIFSTLIILTGFLSLLFGLMFTAPLLKILCLGLFTCSAALTLRRFIKGYCSFGPILHGQSSENIQNSHRKTGITLLRTGRRTQASRSHHTQP